MAKQWKCARCSAQNDEGVLTCSNCRMIRGAVVVPGSFSQSFEPREPIAPSTLDSPVHESTPDAAMPSWETLVDRPGLAVAPVPLWRRLPIGSIILVALIAAGGIGALLFNAGRDASGEINRRGDLEASELRVGDCFDFKDPDAEEFDTVTAVPCAAEHEYELFYAGAMPAGAYPSDAVMGAFVEANCTEAFRAYVGKPYVDSVLEIAWVSPTTESWNLGDRTIQCSVYHPQVQRLTESLKGSGQ